MNTTDLLTTSQAARRLEVCDDTIRNYAKRGILRAERTPLGKLYPLAEVELLAAERLAKRAAQTA